METALPVSLQPLMARYLKGLEPLYSHFYGIYMYGSIALGAFEEQESDIDIIALMQGEWTSDELRQLAAVHAQLLREQPQSHRLDVQYLPLHDVGKMGTIAPHPLLRDGKFVPATTHGDLNAVTWWITKQQGIRLYGPEPSTLPLDVAWKDVQATMRYNLDGYWASKAKRPYLFWFDYWVMTAVATLCRILTAIEEGKIIAKSPALVHWRDRFPPRWQLLLDEAWRLRHHLHQPSRYRSRLKRASETLAFIKYVRKRGHEGLAASSL